MAATKEIHPTMNWADMVSDGDDDVADPSASPESPSDETDASARAEEPSDTIIVNPAPAETPSECAHPKKSARAPRRRTKPTEAERSRDTDVPSDVVRSQREAASVPIVTDDHHDDHDDHNDAEAAPSVDSRDTTSIRVLNPSPAQIYAALVACNLVVHDHAPPDGFKDGSAVQVALYDAYYSNPRGIKCVPIRDAVHLCFKTTTSCLYAKIIAIIYELADHVMTKERISAIDFYDFSSMYGELISFTGIRWFGVYPLYENALIHIETFSHQCTYTCPITSIQRGIRNVNQQDREMLQDYATQHMMMYKHQHNGAQRPWSRDAPNSSGITNRNGRYPRGAQRSADDSRSEERGNAHRGRGGYYRRQDGYRTAPIQARDLDIVRARDLDIACASAAPAQAMQNDGAYPTISIGESLRRANGLEAPRRSARGKRATRDVEPQSHPE